ncbi:MULTISPECIES: hypothetical protein [Parageobacillus]|jgi:hypothetical protein|nr:MULTISPECIES: hypothetical protein [Parageobacillus]
MVEQQIAGLHQHAWKNANPSLLCNIPLSVQQIQENNFLPLPFYTMSGT